MADFEKALAICDKLELKVMPVLFNRWHNEFLDCGGIYIDHFMKGWSWLTREDQFSEYINELVSAHIQDDRILAWDICNEPFTYDKQIKEMKEIEENEYLWLESIYRRIKAIDPDSTVGVSLDGPAKLHNKYRKDKEGKGTQQEVIAGIEKLKEYQVDYNILAVVNDLNAKKPKEVYQLFKEIEAGFIQFIPIVEQDQEGNIISRSVDSKEYGKFLIGVFIVIIYFSVMEAVRKIE